MEDNELQLINVAQCSESELEANLAMEELRKNYNSSYHWCIDCDYLVTTVENCCLTKITNNKNENLDD